MAVVRDDSPIGEGAVLFGSFGNSLVVSKMKIRSVGQIEQMLGFDMMSVN